MKLVSLFLLIFLCSCQPLSDQKKAEKAVTEHLMKSLEDPESYEPVKFDSLRFDSSSVSKNVYYMEALREYALFQKLYDQIKNESTKAADPFVLKTDKKYMKKYRDSIQYYLSKAEFISDRFRPVKIGYVIHHSYRTKNKMNDWVLNNNDFHLDSAFIVK